jgi:hypothetical protein
VHQAPAIKLLLAALSANNSTNITIGQIKGKQLHQRQNHWLHEMPMMTSMSTSLAKSSATDATKTTIGHIKRQRIITERE